MSKFLICFTFLLFAFFFPICIVCDINQFKFNASVPLLLFSLSLDFLFIPPLNDFSLVILPFLQRSARAYSCLDRWEKKAFEKVSIQ